MPSSPSNLRAMARYRKTEKYRQAHRRYRQSEKGKAARRRAYHRHYLKRQYGPVALEVLERDGYRCVWCGATERLELDHIVPRAQGGPTTADNLRVLCRPCHETTFKAANGHRRKPPQPALHWRDRRELQEMDRRLAAVGEAP